MRAKLLLKESRKNKIPNWIKMTVMAAGLLSFESGLAQPFTGKIGIGLGGLGSTALEYVNVVNRERPYWKVGTSDPALLDENGWPKENFKKVFIDHRPFGEWWGDAGIDDPDKYRVDISGVYKLMFNGQAEVVADNDAGNIGAFTIGAPSYDATTNTTTIDINYNKGFGLLFLQFNNTKRTPTSAPNTGVTNIKLIRPGYPKNTTQLFRTEYLNAMSPFSTIRFMDVTEINGHGPATWFDNPKYTTWADRQKPNVVPQTHGAPWEHVIAIGNLTGKDIWINIPHAANDAYIDSLATLIKNNLRNDINIYVEYSNEVWNSAMGFTQHAWNGQAALNEPEDADVREGANGDWTIVSYRRYAKRTKRIGEIFANKFGAGSMNTKIRPVMAWHVGYSRDHYDSMLSWLNSKYGAPKNYLYAIASAPYFNDHGARTRYYDTPQKVVGPAADLTATMWDDSNGNLTGIKEVAGYADKWGLKHLQYEGGPDNGNSEVANLANRILANRIPEMKAAVIHNYKNNWFNANANPAGKPATNDLIMYFVLASNYSRHGAWGAVEDLAHIADPAKSPKYQALCELSGMCGNEPTISITAPSTGTTVNKGSSLNVTVNATDNTGISKVEFFLNEKLMGTDNSTPYSFSIPNMAPGTYNILAKAVDTEGKYKFSQASVIEVNNVTSVEESALIQSNLYVYPTLAQETVKVRFNSPDDEVNLIEISNVLSTTLISKTVKLSDGEEEISVAGLQDGIYLVTVYTNKGKGTSRFVVKK